MRRHSTSRRRAVSVVEVLLAIVVLSLGMMPLLDIMRGARRGIGDSREMLLLQAQTLQLMSEGRALVSAGRLRQLDEQNEEVRRLERDGIETTMKISRLAGGRLLILFVRSQTKERYYETFQVVSDPFTSFLPGETGDDS